MKKFDVLKNFVVFLYRMDSDTKKFVLSDFVLVTGFSMIHATARAYEENLNSFTNHDGYRIERLRVVTFLKVVVLWLRKKIKR